MYSPKVSIYNGVNDKVGKVTTLSEVVERIRTGADGLEETTRYLNVLAQTEPATYKTEKEKLKAFTPSGTFPPYKRKAKHLLAHSAHIIIDIDGLTPGQIADLLAQLAQMPHVVLAFVSPSGEGIKVLVRVDPIPRNDLEHKGAYQACLDFFEDLTEEYGFTIDTSGKDCSRLCFLAHHPHPVVNTATPAIPWDRETYLEAEKKKYVHFESDAKKSYTGTVNIEALDYIDPNDLDYIQWLSVITACKKEGLTWQQVDAWSRRGSKYAEGEVETRWDGLHLDVSWGAVVNLAKQNGYTPPQREKRYTVNTSYKHNTNDMDTERDANKSELLKWIEKTEKVKGKHLLILGSAAGTGKTTAGITTLKRLVYVAKTSGEADKVFDELNKREEDVMRHRSRLYNYNHPDWETLPLGLGENERSCTDPIRCNTHADSLGSPNEVCIRCPFYTECKKDAYLSQAEKERNTSMIIYAWDESFICDSNLAARLKRICQKDKVFILDEANPLGFTQLRSINREMLYDITERFRQTLGAEHEIYQTLKTLLDLISTTEEPSDFINGLSKWIDTIDDIDALDEKIGKFPVSVCFKGSPETALHNQTFVAILRYRDQEKTVPVVDCETADDTPAYFVDRDTPIALNTAETRYMPYSFLLKVGLASLNEPPRRYRNFLKDIKTFLDENRWVDAAPFTFSAKEQSFNFHLKPTLNHTRVIVNTASDPDHLIEEAYRETDVQITRHDGTPPEWKSDLVFQITSGAYLPRHSLLAKNGKKLKLKRFAENMIESFIKPSVKAGLKTLVIAPKAFQEVESVREWTVTNPDEYRAGENAMLTNHHRAEGRNDYQDHDIVFAFHYEPNHNEIQADVKHIYRNAETPLDFTREKQTVSVNGVEFEKTVYTDTRAQAVYNRECRARLMQGPMRLRPNIHKDKIIVYLTAEPVDIPITPVPFTPADKDKFTGDWSDFKKKLQASPQERIDAGESKSKAYRDSNTHTQKKADRNAKVITLWDNGNGLNASEIEQKTGVPRATVNRILKPLKQGDQNSQSTIISTNSRMGKMVTLANPVDTCVESETLHLYEPEPDHDTFFKFMDISACFYEKQQVSPSEVSRYTGIDESEVRRILDNWYQNVVISPGIGEKYWMTERDKKNLTDKILAPTLKAWEENFPGQKILYPPTLYNRHITATVSEH